MHTAFQGSVASNIRDCGNNVATIPTGAPTGIPAHAYQLRPYQTKLKDDAYAALAATRRVCVQLPTGGGKCLSPTTPVLMSDGTTTQAQHVSVGDRVMGDDGKPRTVLSTCSGVEKMYRITPVKGDTWECNESHILTLVFTDTDEVIDISVRDYLQLSKYDKHRLKLFRAPVYSFENAAPELPIKPYYLGMLIGDGHLVRNVSVTTPDVEMVEACNELASDFDLRVRREDIPNNKASTYFLISHKVANRRRDNPLLNVVRALGCNELAELKRVPHAYLTASWEDRLQLLAGLLDTDGHLGHQFEYCTKSPQLKEQVLFLARSLGFAAYASSKVVAGQVTGIERTYYRVCISGDIDQIPTRIKRKQAQPRGQKKNVLRTGFSIEDIGFGMYCGFEIDGNKRFLLGDFTVTHNSVVIASIVTDAVRAGRPVLLMAHRAELIEQLHDKLADHFVDAGIIKAGHPRRDRPVQVASVQTLRSRGDFPAARLLIFDEAHHAIAPTYRMIADEYPHAKILGFTATPCKPSGGGLGYDVFDAMVCGPTVPELIDMGALVSPVVYSVPAEGLDTLRTTAGDYNQRDLARWADKSVLYGDLVATYKATADGRKCVVFAVSVELSQRYAREYNEAGIRAEHIDGTTPADERAAIFARFRSGVTRVLCNVAVATEGVDIPDCSVVQVARPTKSIPLWLQMVGRGMRPSPDKTDCIILDHGNATKACGFPDATREWDLDATAKRKRESVDMVELDLALPEAERSSIEHLHMVRLERITPPDPHAAVHPELRRLMTIVDQNGWKNDKGHPKYAWALDAYRKGGGVPTRAEVEHIRKLAHYHAAWVDRQMGEARGNWRGVAV